MHGGCTSAWERVLFLLKRDWNILRSEGHKSRYGSGLALLEEGVLGNGLPFRGSLFSAFAEELEHCHRHWSCQCVFLVRWSWLQFHSVIFQILVLATIQKQDSAMEETGFISHLQSPQPRLLFQDYSANICSSKQLYSETEHKHR